MKYSPLEIPLQDLGPDPGELPGYSDGPNSSSSQFSHSPSLPHHLLSPDLDSHSDTSDVFDQIDEFSKNGDPETFETDPRFVNQLSSLSRPAFTRKHVLSGCLIGACLWATLIVVYASENTRNRASEVWHGPSTNIVGLGSRNVTLNEYKPSNRNVTLENYRKGMYWPELTEIQWLKQRQFPDTPTSSSRGFYLHTQRTSDSTQFVVGQANSDYSQVVLDSVQFSYDNSFYYADDLVLNPAASVDDQEAFHLLRSDSVAQWRHSAWSHYWLRNQKGQIFPVSPTGEPQKLHFCKFSPDGRSVAFGFEHDVYIMDVSTKNVTRVTNTGSKNVFNGKPDWVYEEEIYPQDNMVWWSPDSQRLVYSVINDTQVANYNIDYYIKSQDELGEVKRDSQKDSDVHQYPKHTSIKYPKPGAPNPLLQLCIHDMKSHKNVEIDNLHDDKVGHDFVLYDAAWLGSRFLVKVADRTSSVVQKRLLSGDKTMILVSTTNATEYGGWVEKTSPMVAVKSENAVRYLDRVVSDGLVQLALFDSPESTEHSKLLRPVSAESPLAFDSIDNCVYGVFGTNLNTTFAKISLEDGKLTTLAQDGAYRPNFSPGGQYAELKYLGPQAPWQKIVALSSLAEGEVKLQDIHPIKGYDLKSVLSETNVPTRVRSQVTVGQKDSVQLNMIEIFPPNFDPKKKYPLLVHAYGGPGSTTVTDHFSIDFQDIVSGQLNAMVLIIDPRGTGSDDWKLRSYANKNIGFWEPRDLTTVTKDYIKQNKFVDGEKTAIWGWSYGGFTALKTLEYDSGKVFKYGMAVAPVTNWMFYDSVYTERYMKSPADNENYEKVSRINNFESFKQVTRFLVMHGTADDNVHLQNSMWLLDRFDTSGVENYDVHFFPDSDHSIYYHNANAVVYDKLFWWLKKAFQGYWK